MTINTDNLKPLPLASDLDALREESRKADQALILESGYTPPEPQDYFATSWTDCLANPEPIEWLVVCDLPKGARAGLLSPIHPALVVNVHCSPASR